MLNSVVQGVDPWSLQVQEDQLTDREKQMRERFIAEYMFDRNEYNAALRCGFPPAYAREFAAKYMGSPYVQQEILKYDLQEDTPESLERERRMIKTSLINEMHNADKATARIAAANSLKAILGMDAPTKVDQNVNLTSPVEFYLPSNGRDEEG